MESWENKNVAKIFHNLPCKNTVQHNFSMKNNSIYSTDKYSVQWIQIM